MKLKGKKTGFTIIEILTVMSIIVILISLLVPALHKVRQYARVVTQKGQFDTITKGLEMFRNAHDDEYPDSGPTVDPTSGDYYCGAMRLCEAMMGQDGMGFHPDSKFLANAGTDAAGNPLYPLDLCAEILPADYTPALISNIRTREKYIDTDKIKAYKLHEVFVNPRTVAPFKDNVAGYPNAVISDVFLRAQLESTCTDRSSEKVGMPILYYKADVSKLYHTYLQTDCVNNWPQCNIYNWEDNYWLTSLGLPWESTQTTAHPLYDGGGNAQPAYVFYTITKNPKSTATPRPHNESSYILISAGWDGLYGTRDDIFNFTQ